MYKKVYSIHRDIMLVQIKSNKMGKKNLKINSGNKNKKARAWRACMSRFFSV